MRYLALYCLLLCCNQLHAQTRKETRKIQRKESSLYIETASGASRALYRDFATSPLFYTGIHPTIQVGFQRIHPSFEKKSGLNFQLGKAANSGIYSESSKNWYLSGFHSKLYTTNWLKKEKWQLHLGYQLTSTVLFRYNEGLENNAFGYEWFNNLFLSGKINYDISRSSNKSITFLKRNFNLKAKQRFISYQFNVGILNSAIRNNFAYLGQSAVVNKFVPFDNYTFYLYNGYRFQSQFCYTRKLNNRNQIDVRYNWDLLSTRKEHNPFNFANHQLLIALLFNIR